MRKTLAALTVLATAAVAPAAIAPAAIAQVAPVPSTVVHLPLAGGSHFPIAQAVEVPPGYSTIYLSGAGASMIDKNADKNAVASYGDTETQARSALASLEKTLAGYGLTFADVVQAHVFLKADPATGKLDSAGLLKAWSEKFGTAAQPNLPARSAFGVATLANPGWLLEIEMVAVRKPH